MCAGARILSHGPVLPWRYVHAVVSRCWDQGSGESYEWWRALFGMMVAQKVSWPH